MSILVLAQRDEAAQGEGSRRCAHEEQVMLLGVARVEPYALFRMLAELLSQFINHAFPRVGPDLWAIAWRKGGHCPHDLIIDPGRSRHNLRIRLVEIASTRELFLERAINGKANSSGNLGPAANFVRVSSRGRLTFPLASNILRLVFEKVS